MNCECGSPMKLVERERTTYRETTDSEEKLTEKGHTRSVYRVKDNVWLCPKCGKEQKQLLEG